MPSKNAVAMSAGPIVIIRKCSDGGYFVQFRNESTVKTAGRWTNQGDGSP